MMNCSQRSKCWMIFGLISTTICSFIVFDYADHGQRLTKFTFYTNDLIYKNILLNTSLVNDYENSNNSNIENAKYSKAFFEEHERFLNNTLKHEKHPLKFFPLEPKLMLNKFPNSFKRELEFNYTKKDNMKKILYWNDIYGNTFFGLGYGQAPFKFGQCEYQNCFATSDRTKFLASEVDAIMWHFRSSDRSLPNPRYSIIATRRVPDTSFLTGDYTQDKTLMAAWFISNCDGISGRMNMKNVLKKYIHLDIYGGCGEMSCPRKTTDQCYQMAAKKYFFYLSFENSLCDDYITEKFFNVLKYDIVPVVYGSGPYWKHAPPHSYIDAFDFHSLKELTDYMIYLSKNPSEYNDYFRWKAYYTVLPQVSRRFPSLCKMCEFLNTDNQIKKNTTSRYDLVNWFVQGSHCMTGSTPVVKKFISGQNQTSTINEYRMKKNVS